MVVGGLAGVLAWVYDFDFFLNAGGPERPIAASILRATHLEQANAVVNIFWPLVVLIAAGVVLGLVVSTIVPAEKM